MILQIYVSLSCNEASTFFLDKFMDESHVGESQIATDNSYNDFQNESLEFLLEELLIPINIASFVMLRKI